MAEYEQSSIFRKKTLDRIASPEQLTDYLCVTDPGIWAVLAAVILLLGGLFVWAGIGTLETTAAVKVAVEDHRAEVVPMDKEVLREGMKLRAGSVEATLASTTLDDYGRVYGVAEVSLPDGVYDGTVVLEETHPIGFLLESR